MNKTRRQKSHATVPLRPIWRMALDDITIIQLCHYAACRILAYNTYRNKDNFRTWTERMGQGLSPRANDWSAFMSSANLMYNKFVKRNYELRPLTRALHDHMKTLFMTLL